MTYSTYGQDKQHQPHLSEFVLAALGLDGLLDDGSGGPSTVGRDSDPDRPIPTVRIGILTHARIDWIYNESHVFGLV